VKILLLGKGGQVGWELQRSLAPLGQVVALDWDSADGCGDFTRPQELLQTVRSLAPQVIVNAAAHTAVDKAESEPELARLINATAVGELARQAQALGAWLVHYSTDYVFDGSGCRPWLERDVPAPLNVYGHTKLEGERLVQQSCERHLVFRTSWVYGARGGNFARTMLRLAAEREKLQVIDDQIGAPTGADLLADVTALALRQVCSQTGQADRLAGLYHLTASGQTSWHGYASHVIEQARQRKPDLDLRVREVAAVASSAFPTAARRPHNSRLDTERLRQAFGLNLPHWQEGVDRMLTEILSIP
jgi:dTDP-4-dehydrorhamnose reductase